MKASFFDLDGTLTSSQWWRGFMGYFREAGRKRLTHLAFLLVHYPLYMLHRARLISASRFRRPWAAHLAWYLRGIAEQDAEPIWRHVIDRFLPQYWRQDSLELLRSRQERGDLVVLVSAGMSPLLRRVGEELGVEHTVGSHPEMRVGRFTGRVAGEVCISEQKAVMCGQYLERNELQVDLAASEAFADSTSDLSLLEMVGRPVAVYPDRGLRRIARERGWEVFPNQPS